jgi:hypothetical protein
MKIHLVQIGDLPLAGTLAQLARTYGTAHELCDDADDADLVVLCGPFAYEPELVLRHPLYRAYRSKCAVYTEEDPYLPLVPGVYASPRRGLSTLSGRVRSFAYANATGLGGHGNPVVIEAGEGGTAPARREPEYLFSFIGTSNCRLRARLLGRLSDEPDAMVADSRTSYNHFDPSAPGRQTGQDRYLATLLSSRFVLCPRGWGSGSMRLFEAMSLGVAPVVISDRYVLPHGPDWERCTIRVRERDVGRLPNELRLAAERSEALGAQARREWERWFAPPVLFDHLVDEIVTSLRAGRRVEPLYRLLQPGLVRYFRLRLWATQRLARASTQLSRLMSRA